MHDFRRSTLCRLSVGLLAALTLAACSNSRDIHEYRSTPSLPVNIAIKEAYTREVLWYKEIPVYHTLKLDFDRYDEIEWFKTGDRPATHLKWNVRESYGKDNGKEVEAGALSLPGTPILFEATYRPAPEYPPNYVLDRDNKSNLSKTNIRPSKYPAPAKEETPKAEAADPPDEVPAETETAPVEPAPAPVETPAEGPAVIEAQPVPATQPADETVPLPDL